MTDALQPAALDWSGAIPHSRRFNDGYFSADGIDEARHVFVAGNGIPERLATGQDMVIGETGFGTGLNFLLTWSIWRQQRRPGRLTFISVEGYPLTVAELARAQGAWPELAPLAQALRDAWPPAVGGFHTVDLDGGQLRLLLLLGEVGTMLADLRAPVDAWYLDGFAPARNPAMWCPEVLSRVAALTRPGGTLATFTVAGQVRRDLSAAGFQVEKTPGYGRKREMLRGRLQTAVTTLSHEPWFELPPAQRPGRVAVIGAGLAGAAMVSALAARQIPVTLIERYPTPAAGASGNPVGVVMPAPQAGPSTNAAWYRQGYLHSLTRLAGVASWQQTGVLQVAWNPAQQDRHTRLLDAWQAPTSVVTGRDSIAASELAGVAVDTTALHFPGGGWVHPPALARALLAPVRETHYHREALTLQRVDDHWQVVGDGGAVLAHAEVVILATGTELQRFSPLIAPALRRYRGQLSAWPTVPPAPRCVVCGPAYVSPAYHGLHWVGATYSEDSDPVLRATDHQRNHAALASYLPTLAARFTEPAQGRVAFRATMVDHLPMVGPIPHPEDYPSAYRRQGKGLRYTQPIPPYAPGLWVSVGHGSRGLVSAPLAGELLAAMILGEPLPVPWSVVRALHPGRFLIRGWRRGEGQSS